MLGLDQGGFLEELTTQLQAGTKLSSRRTSRLTSPLPRGDLEHPSPSGPRWEDPAARSMALVRHTALGFGTQETGTRCRLWGLRPGPSPPALGCPLYDGGESGQHSVLSLNKCSASTTVPGVLCPLLGWPLRAGSRQKAGRWK